MKTQPFLSPTQPARYRLRLQSRLETCPDSVWADWLTNLAVNPAAAGQTILEGDLSDQAALFGLLSFIRDQGLVLLSIELIQIL